VSTARILRQSAILFASDLPASIAYWQSKLGFDKYGIFGEPPRFAIMERDDTFAMLKQAPKGHAIVPYWKISEGLWNAYFWVDDIAALFEEMRSRGATIDYGLCDQPYDVREFGVRDPDDQDIGFGQVLTKASGEKS
jgi:catechol 2,3-dioxygenase-like lactoylglutathione lyase family enzyme